MALDRRQKREAEAARTLDALLAIGVSVSELSSNLAMMLRESLNQTSLLMTVDRKLDMVLRDLHKWSTTDGGK